MCWYTRTFVPSLTRVQLTFQEPLNVKRLLDILLRYIFLGGEGGLVRKDASQKSCTELANKQFEYEYSKVPPKIPKT